MMRIKEAILRKKIIQQLNEEWKDYEDEIAALLRQETNANHPNELLNLLRVAKSMQLKQQKISTASFSPRTPRTPHSPTKSSSKFPFSPELSTLKESKRWQRRRRRVFDERENDPLDEQSGLGDEHKKSLTRKESQDGPKQHPLQAFVDELQTKLTVLQKRALKVTWKRLSEAPKTSGRGTIHIMEKIFEKMVELEPKVPSLFYKSAFISCCHDRKDGRAVGDTISTTRDHAHILVQYIDTMLQLMFEGKADRQMPSPEEIGAYHVRLYPLGLQRHMWQVMGESMAEVMFVQECVRAYPHAASAWSLLSVAFTDKIYGACKPPKDPSEISITCKPIIEREDSPSSDSGCPYSNKSSMRDDHSGSEGTSGVESVSPHKEPPNSIGNRFGKLRPPGLLHPMNLSQEAIYEPPIDYTPIQDERPLSPPIDYPLDTPEGIDHSKKSRFREIQNGNDSLYQSNSYLEINGTSNGKKVSLDCRKKGEMLRKLTPKSSPTHFRKSMVNLHGASVDSQSFPHSSRSTFFPLSPQPTRSLITQKHSFCEERSPDFRQRRRNFQDRPMFRSISPNSRHNSATFPFYCDSPLETFL